MTVTRADPALCRELCQRIRRRWRRPLDLDADVRHYLASALGADSEDKIAGLLDDPDQYQAVGLLDLLLDPDRDFLIEMDGLTQGIDLSDADTDRIVAGLGQPFWQIAVRPGPGLPARALAVSADAARRLIERMSIGRPIDPVLIRTINTTVPSACRAGVRVCLRRQPRPLSRHQIDFVQRFLEQGAGHGTGFADDLAALLGLLAQLPVAEPVCSALIRRRDVLTAALDALEVHTRRLKAGAMETLMLQGLQMPYIDGPQTVATLALIDRLYRRLCPAI